MRRVRSGKESVRRSAEAVIRFEEYVPAAPVAPLLARRMVHGRFARRLPGPRLDDLKLAVSEVVTNAVQHGGLAPNEWIGLILEVEDDVLRVEVQDPGRGFDQKRLKKRRLALGLTIVNQLADHWGVVQGPPTRVWLEFDLPAERRAG